MTLSAVTLSGSVATELLASCSREVLHLYPNALHHRYRYVVLSVTDKGATKAGCRTGQRHHESMSHTGAAAR